jgi:hypothetical protein
MYIFPSVNNCWLHLQQAAQKSPKGSDGFVTLAELEERRDNLLQHHARLYQPHSGRVEALRRQWARGFPRDSIRSHFTKINRTLQRTIPDVTQRAFYQVSSDRSYGNTRYGLRLPPGKIELREGER